VQARQRADAARMYVVIEALGSLAFALIATFNIVYQATVVGLGPFELVLVGTVLEGTCLLAEVPTGALADMRSRRAAVIVGNLLIGAGFVLEAAIPSLGAVLAAQVVWGIGASFASGAFEAWLADEVGEEQAAPIFLRGARAALAGSLAGIGLAAVTASIVSPRASVLLGGSAFVAISLWLAVRMGEHGFSPVPHEGSHLRELVRTTRAGARVIRGRPVLRAVVLVALISGLSSEAWDRLWTPRLLDVGLPAAGALDPVAWFAVIAALVTIAGIVALRAVERGLDTSDVRRVARALACIDALLPACMVVFALAGEPILAIAALVATGLLRSLREPLIAAIANLQLESATRATGLSLSNQANAFGQLAGGPALGALAAAVSIPVALVASATIALAAAPVWGRLSRRESPRA
jgi:MFS transporter, DHA3 family, tetracycline resistance protein